MEEQKRCDIHGQMARSWWEEVREEETKDKPAEEAVANRERLASAHIYSLRLSGENAKRPSVSQQTDW